MSKNLVNIITVNIDDLTPCPFNTNKMDDGQFRKLRESIARIGSFKPIVARVRELDGRFEILGGEHRWRAMQDLGWETVEIANLGVISDVTAKQIAVMDNERFGEDDEIQFQALLATIQSDIDYSLSDIMHVEDFDLDAAQSMSGVNLDDSLFDSLDDDPAEDAIERVSEKLESDVMAGTMMRFLVPTDQAENVRGAIEAVIRSQKIEVGNDTQNAGEALAFIINAWRQR